MIDILLLVSKESATTNTKRVTKEQVLNELQERASDTKSSKKLTQENDFNLSQEDFMMWCIQSPSNLLQPFLDLLFEVCHVVLGLRPQCRHLEYNIGKWANRTHLCAMQLFNLPFRFNRF